MIEENVFVPKIFLCGSREEFFSRVGQRPFEIVGQVQFFGKINGQEFNFLRDGKFLLNGKFVEYPELLKALKERGVDFIVFNDHRNLKPLFVKLSRIGCPRSQLVTLEEFNNYDSKKFVCENFARRGRTLSEKFCAHKKCKRVARN